MDKTSRRKKLKRGREEKGLCVYCGTRTPKPNQKGCKQCLAKKSQQNCDYAKQNRERATAYHRKLRLDVLAKYGNQCVCCGESNPWFLTIDHILNDGAEERKRLYGSQNGCSRKWLLKLRREPRRDDLQVLCYNCNIARSIFGICPHNPNFDVDLTILETDNRRKGNFGLCCKIEWPSDEDLLKMVQQSNCSAVARKLGVHDTVVRGRLKRRGLYSFTKL